MHIPHQPAPYLTPRSDTVMKSRQKNICIDPGDQSEKAYLLMTTSAGTRMQSQRRKRMMQGVEDPAQEHQFPWDSKIYSVPMGKTMTLQVKRSTALLQAKRTYMLRRRSFLIFIFVLFHSMRWCINLLARVLYNNKRYRPRYISSDSNPHLIPEFTTAV